MAFDNTFEADVSSAFHTQSCFASHIGPWCIEPKWFQEALALINSGVADFTYKADIKAGDSGPARSVAMNVNQLR